MPNSSPRPSTSRAAASARSDAGPPSRLIGIWPTARKNHAVLGSSKNSALATNVMRRRSTIGRKIESQNETWLLARMAPPGPLDRPPDAAQPVAQGVPPVLVDLVHDLRVVGRLVHGHGGGDLDGLEGAVVEVALQLGQRLHDLGVADQEADPPSRHRERL